MNGVSSPDELTAFSPNSGIVLKKPIAHGKFRIHPESPTPSLTKGGHPLVCMVAFSDKSKSVINLRGEVNAAIDPFGAAVIEKSCFVEYRVCFGFLVYAIAR